MRSSSQLEARVVRVPPAAAQVSIRDELVSEADALQLPPNFLDELIDRLGGPKQVWGHVRGSAAACMLACGREATAGVGWQCAMCAVRRGAAWPWRLLLRSVRLSVCHGGGPWRYGAQVAEMTGRSGRLVRRSEPEPGAGGGATRRPKLVYELRAKPDGPDMDSLNSARG
jgi:hypothetical protein